MICFRCGTPIPEGAPRCPTCAVDTGATQKTAVPLPPRTRAPGLFEPGYVVVDRYEIRYLLGEGPTGVTYRALDHEVGIDIALKVVAPERLPERELRDRFVKGLARLTQVVHPNVVRTFEVGVHADRAFLAMQLCEGLSLRKLLGLRKDKGESFALGDLESIIQQVARGLSAMHKRGLVAGALRPESIIVLPDAVKVADAGVWRQLPHVQLEAVSQASGAARYLAPEMRTGALLDARADTYSLAVIIEEMLGDVARVPAALAEVLALAKSNLASERPGVDALSDDVVAIARTGKRAPPPADTVVQRPPRPPVPVAKLPGSDEKTEKTERTSRISDEELAQLLPDREATRQVKQEEILELRAKTTGDTQQIAMDELLPADDEPEEELTLPPTSRLPGTIAPPPPKAVVTDAFDDMKTIPVEKLPPEEATVPAPVVTQPPPPPAQPPPPPAAAMAPPPAPVRPPAAAKPPEPVDDDDLTPLPPPAIELTPVPGPLPKAPSGRTNGTARPSTLAQAAPVAPVPPMATIRVSPPPPPQVQFGASVARSGGLSPSGVVKIITAFLIATAVALVVLWHRQTTEAEAERTAKEKQLLLLREREAAARKQEPPAAAADAAALAAAVERDASGCPLGAKRNHEGGHDFCIDAYEYPGGHIVPRTGVTWADAEKVCESRGARLCTRREWVASCMGPGGTTYPYGNTHQDGLCNIDGTPREAGTFPRCKSPIGAYDMIGNVSEWVAEKFIVGGSALRHDVRTRCDFSQKIDPDIGYSDVGFRCCTDIK